MSRILKRAIEWIAENDNRDEKRLEAVAKSATVRLVEFVTSAKPEKIAKAIVAARLAREAKEALDDASNETSPAADEAASS